MKLASALSVLALLAFACSSTTTTTTTTTPDGGTSGENEDAGKAKDAGKSDEEEEDASTEATCAEETGQQECAQCCANAHPAGYKVYSGAISTCMCKAANCQTECADTACAATPLQPDSACVTCINSKQASCQQDLTDACTPSKTCMEFYGCLTDSSCLTKK